MTLHGGRCLHERIAKKPKVELVDHVHQIMATIDRYIGDVPNSCLKFEHNQAFLSFWPFKLTQSGTTELLSYTLRFESFMT